MRRAPQLEAKGVRFLVDGIADVAGLRTTWFCDPWDNVFILLEKVRIPTRRTTASTDASDRRHPAGGPNGVAMYQLWPSGSRTPYSRCP